MNEWIERARLEAEVERTRVLNSIGDVLADYARINAAIVALGGESRAIAAPARLGEPETEPEPEPEAEAPEAEAPEAEAPAPEPASEPEATEPEEPEAQEPEPTADRRVQRATERQQAIWDYLRKNGPTERLKIGEALAIPKGSWGTLLSQLEVRFGIRSVIVPGGSGRGTSMLMLPSQRLSESAVDGDGEEADEAKGAGGEEVPPELASMPAVKGRTQLVANQITAARKQKQVWDAILAIDAPFIILELVDRVDVPQARIGDYLRQFVDEGMIRPTGKSRRGPLFGPGKPAPEYEIAQRPASAQGPPRPTEAAEAAEAAEATTAPDLSLEFVRDYSRKMGGFFSPAQLAAKMEEPEPEGAGISVTAEELWPYLDELVARETLGDVSPTPDQRLYEFVKPTEPGRAAELDAERRRADARSGGRSGGVPVPGTGRPERAAHGNVTALLKAVESVGAKWRRTTSDHFLITLPDGRRATIGGTPNSGGFKQDSLKLRKLGIPV